MSESAYWITWALICSVGFVMFSFVVFSQEANAEIIGITLSRTCLQIEKNNVTSNCPTYKDLEQFDNTIKSVSGEIVKEDGAWTREHSKYKNHCNFYHPSAFPLVIVVDPDGCWFRERGIKTITIQAISPDKMLYKLTADSELADRLKELTKDEREYFEDKSEAEDLVDRLEDNIESKEKEIKRLRDSLKEGDKTSLEKRNINFKIKFAVDSLQRMKDDLKKEESKFNSASTKLDRIKDELTKIKTEAGSRLVINGTTNLGVGRYVEECREATVGANMTLITDTINYMISKCDKDQTEFDSRKTTYIDPTPINIQDHKWYQYMKWLREAVERCIVRC